MEDLRHATLLATIANVAGASVSADAFMMRGKLGGEAPADEAPADDAVIIEGLEKLLPPALVPVAEAPTAVSE